MGIKNLLKKLPSLVKIENETLHVEFEVSEILTQGMLERFESFVAHDQSDGIGVKTLYGKYLRAAIKVGWVKSGPIMNNDQIANADPRIVAVIGKHLVSEYNEASKIPN